jgi:hypothetical protein
MADREEPFRKQRDERLKKAKQNLRKALKTELPQVSTTQINRLIKVAEAFVDENDRAWGDFNAEVEMLYEDELY